MIPIFITSLLGLVLSGQAMYHGQILVPEFRDPIPYIAFFIFFILTTISSCHLI